MNKHNLPQLPDYFGFLMGFLLLWLIYTGYGAVKGVFLNTHKSAVELTAKAKITTKESVDALHSQAKDIIKSNSDLVANAKDKVDLIQQKLENSRARLAEPKAEEPVKKKNWSSEQLKKANSFINEIIATIGESIYGATEESEIHSEQSVIPEREVVKRDDSLEWFQ